jgi:hypothetical protein
MASHPAGARRCLVPTAAGASSSSTATLPPRAAARARRGRRARPRARPHGGSTSQRAPRAALAGCPARWPGATSRRRRRRCSTGALRTMAPREAAGCSVRRRSGSTRGCARSRAACSAARCTTRRASRSRSLPAEASQPRYRCAAPTLHAQLAQPRPTAPAVTALGAIVRSSAPERRRDCSSGSRRGSARTRCAARRSRPRRAGRTTRRRASPAACWMATFSRGRARLGIVRLASAAPAPQTGPAQQLPRQPEARDAHARGAR